MVKNPLQNKDSYELIENDAGDIIITIYANQIKPTNPTFYIDEKENSIRLTKATEDIMFLENLATESIEKIKKLKEICICELKYNPDATEDDDFEVESAYIATNITNKQTKTSTPLPPTTPQKEETLQEKIKKAKETVLQKREEQSLLKKNENK